MKKALILSLGLAVVLGLAGCTTGDKIKDAGNTVVETVEKPVMVLGEGLEGAADAVVETGGDIVEATGDVIKDIVE